VSSNQNEIAEFIERNCKLNPADIALRLSKKDDWPKAYILNQINGRQKAAKKFPFLSRFPEFEFPNPTAVAQASSEDAARYKASLVNGSSIADLTGGMGIDSYFLAQHFKKVTYVEKQIDLFHLAKENLKLLAGETVQSVHDSAENFLKRDIRFDWIFLDPDRRAGKSKTFQLETSSPNVAALLPLLFKRSNRLMVKLSPLLDIKEGLNQLPSTRFVYVIAVEGECKELLFLMEKGFQGESEIIAVNLNKKEHHEFNFKLSDEMDAQLSYSEPEKYLYEPNAAILKSGGFKSLALKFDLKKLSKNTHLYTSKQLLLNFPGRIIEVEKVGKAEKKFLNRANVVSRNFPFKPEEIRKRYGIKEGKVHFLYACSLFTGKKVFIGGKLTSANHNA